MAEPAISDIPNTLANIIRLTIVRFIFRSPFTASRTTPGEMHLHRQTKTIENAADADVAVAALHRAWCY